MEVDQVLQNISERQKRVAEITDIQRSIDLDVGNLTAWDPESIVVPKAGKAREEYFRQLARDGMQVVLNKLYSIDTTEVKDGEKVLKLPPPTIVLPRAKQVPEAKPPTKWERFAKDKGIKPKSSKRRENKVYDDTADKWIPRYGYERAKNEEQKDWLIEIPDQADPHVDYFAQKKEEKKERVAKNKFQQLRNKAHATRN